MEAILKVVKGKGKMSLCLCITPWRRRGVEV